MVIKTILKIKIICISQSSHKYSLNKELSSTMFQQGDLVFAKCSKSWPAKITKVFNETTFKVDFYYHNSFAIVDQKDLEMLNQNTIQYYREKYKKEKNNEETLALEGIKFAQIQFLRRAELHKIESKKWISDVPNESQKQEFQKKMKKQIKRPVIKPKQIPKKQTSKPNKKSKEKNKKQITKTQQTKKIEDKNKEEITGLTIRTRSKKTKIDDTNSEQIKKKQLEVSSKVKILQPKQKDTHKQKKIKKKAKQKKTKIQNKKKQKSKQKQQNISVSLQSQNKVEVMKQSSKQIQNEVKEISQQKFVDSSENPLNTTSMIQENDSYISLPEAQKFKQTLEPVQRINSHIPIFQKETEQRSQFPSSFINQSFSETENKQSSLIVEKDKFQQSNSIVESNHLFQGLNKLNQQEINQINTENIQIIEQIKPLQNTIQVEIQMEKMIPEQQDIELNDQNNIASMNNLDLSPSSFQVSLAQEHIAPQNNDLKANQLDQQKEQIQIIPQNSKEIYFINNQQEIQIQQQLQAGQIPSDIPQVSINQNQQNLSPLTDNITLNQQNKVELIQKQSSNQILQNQSNLQCLQVRILEENNRLITNDEDEDENSQKSHQNQQGEYNFQNLTPSTRNLLFRIINKTIPLEQQFTNKKVHLEQHPQTITLQQKNINVQPIQNIMQQGQKQQASVNSSTIANNISFYQVNLKDIQISSGTSQQIEDSRKYFQRVYGDFTINNRDYIKMVRGIPELKKELQNSDKKLIAICTNQYLRILDEFIAPQNSLKQMKNLEMWQRQLLISILDTQTLDLKILVEYQIMFNMMSFISAFEQNKTSKRAQCHVQYLFTVSRLDTYLNRYIKQRFKQGLMHKASSYDQLIHQFNKRIQVD